MSKWTIVVLLVIILPAATVSALSKGNADVLSVRAVETAKDIWTFEVTVSHPDKGWKDYANGWDVVLPDNTVLKTDPDDEFTRVLWHPHETEQPFTRSQRGLKIPSTIQKIRIRAHDLMNGFGGKEVVVDLTQPEGDSFKVKRFGH
jgi:hypothetical protein